MIFRTLSLIKELKKQMPTESKGGKK